MKNANRAPAHTITLEPWSDQSVGVRLSCEMGCMMLWPLSPDDRMTVLISLLANHIGDVAETDDQIDAIIDVIRMTMKMNRQESPPTQPH